MYRQRKTATPKNRVTLDAKHNEMVKHFKDLKKSIPQKKKEIAKLEKELGVLKKKKNKDLSEEELDRKFEIEDKIKEIKDEIEKIDNNKDENNYYLKTSKLLYSYYENIDNTASGIEAKPVEKKGKGVQTSSVSISSFFEPKSVVVKQEIKENEEKRISDEQKKEPSVAEEGVQSRAHILNEYLKVVDPNYYNREESQIVEDYCEDCGIEMTLIQSEGIIMCKKCGLSEHVIVDSDKPSYKDPRVEIGYFAYKRINHLKEVLYQAQGSESTEIPQEVYDQIFLEIKKEKITNLAVLTPQKIKEYLKRLQLNKYYEHTAFILNKISGVETNIISKEVEDQLCSIFKAIQEPFSEICPKNRKNFLSYNYVLHKCVEYLGHPEYKHLFPLLKSREKLILQDCLWAQICTRTGITFTKSV